MTINGQCGCNLSAAQPGSGNSVLVSSQFQAGLAEELINFVDEEKSALDQNLLELQTMMASFGHGPFMLDLEKKEETLLLFLQT